MIGARVADDWRARRHPLTELFRERGERRLVHAERAQAVKREGHGDPARVELRAGRVRAAAADAIDEAREPCAAGPGAPEPEEAVARRQRPRAREQEMLDVVEFEHDASLRGSLHLVEHLSERCFQLERLLDFVGADVRILAIFEKARAMMLADEFDEGGSI